MLVLPGKIHDLGYLGFGHLISIDTAHPYAALMHVPHDAGCLLPVLIEEPFEDVDDEFNGCVIIVQNQYLIHRGLLRLRLRLDDDTRTRPFLAALSVLAHFGPRDNAAFWPDDIGFLPLRKRLFLQPGKAHGAAGYSLR